MMNELVFLIHPRKETDFGIGTEKLGLCGVTILQMILQIIYFNYSQFSFSLSVNS